MAIKAGELITVGNQVLIDRIQTGGPGQVDIPQEKIYELGNYSTVATVLDTPNLSFSLDSIDTSAELEALLTGRDFASDSAGQEYDLSKCKPIDVISQFKAGKTAASPDNVIGGVAVPFLSLESLSYRFGLRDNAGISGSLRGDSIFYARAGMKIQEATGTATPNQAVALSTDAYPYKGAGADRYALAVTLSSGTRLRYGIDYTETATGAGPAKTVTVTVLAAVPITEKIRVTYATSTTQTYNSTSVHAPDSTSRPAAVRGRNIKVYLAPANATNANSRTSSTFLSGVQSVNMNWRANLDRDEEFGNEFVVAQDYDVPEVDGSIDLRPTDFTDLMNKLKTISGVSTTTEVIGALQRTPLQLHVEILSPTDGSTYVKGFYVPDARFTVPGFQGQVQQKQGITLNYVSDGGSMYVYKGQRPTA